MELVRRQLSRNKMFWALFALGSIAETVYLLYFLASFYLPYYYATPLLDLGKITRYQFDAGWKFVGAFSALFLAYYCAYRVSLRERPDADNDSGDESAALHAHASQADTGSMESKSSVLLVLFFGLVFSLTLLWIYPIGAADVFDYLFHGRILIHYGQNPFSSLIADYPNDPLYAYPAWKLAPSVYGPIWIFLSAIASVLARDDLLLNLLLYKGLVTCFFLFTAVLVYLALRHLAPRYALSGTILFAWNPLVIYETAANGHNDMVMGFFLMLGIYFLAAKRDSLSVLSVVASGLMKFAAGLLAPLFLISIAKRLPGWHSRIAFTAKVSIISLLLSVALYAPFWIGPEMLGIERREGLFTASLPTIAMLALKPWLGEETSQFLVARISALLFVAVFIWVAIRIDPTPSKLLEASFELFYVYMLFFCLWFQPWYLIWLVPIAAVIPKLDIANRTMLFSYTAILSYFVFIFLWIWNANEFDLMAVQGRAVAVIYPLPILFTIRSLVGKRNPTRLNGSINQGVDGKDLRLDRYGDDERSSRQPGNT